MLGTGEGVMGNPFYMSKKGKKVVLRISTHAVTQLEKRWWALFHTRGPEDPHQWIADRFNASDRVENLSTVERSRLKKHGNDTLYFRGNDFTFVVQDRTIVTIEISNKGFRHLNKVDIKEIL